MAATPVGAADEVTFDFAPLIRVYKSGRVERLLGEAKVPAGAHADTAVVSKDVTVSDAVSARLYLPDVSGDTKLPVIVYYHGGGFVIESASSPTYHGFLNTLSAAAGALVVSVEYRLAPEHLIPAAYNDAHAALDWVFAAADPWISDLGDLTRVFLAGDSAGGNLAHNIAMSGSHRVRGIILLHPWFWGAEAIGGEETDLEKRKHTGRLWEYVCPDAVNGVDDPRMNPLSPAAPDLAALKCDKVFVAVAALDFLVERGRAYADAVRQRGGRDVELLDTDGEGHVFFLFKPGCDKANELVERVVQFVNGQ